MVVVVVVAALGVLMDRVVEVEVVQVVAVVASKVLCNSNKVAILEKDPPPPLRVSLQVG